MFNKTGYGIRIATKIGADVQVVCESVCTNFDKKRITYKKVTIKKRWTQVRNPEHGRLQSLI